MWEENLGTQGIHLIEGVHSIWVPFNTGFTVYHADQSYHISVIEAETARRGAGKRIQQTKADTSQGSNTG